jgi:VanZ family protein
MAFLDHPKFIALARIAFVIALAAAVIMALLPKPPALPIDRFGDKFEHVLAFAVLAGLAALAFPKAAPWRTAERLSFLGALIEVAQSLPIIRRDCDFRDWVADTIAVVVVTGIAALVLPRLRRD